MIISGLYFPYDLYSLMFIDFLCFVINLLVFLYKYILSLHLLKILYYFLGKGPMEAGASKAGPRKSVEG